jgi:hypothetical protein
VTHRFLGETNLRGHPKPANANETGDVDFGVRYVAFVDMSNALSEAKKQQAIALGRLGWPLRRIEQETGVRRETAGAYLRKRRLGVRSPGAWGRRPPAKPANGNGVTTGSDAAKPTHTINPNPENLSHKEQAKAKPANANEGTTGFGVESTGLEVEDPKRISSASACEPFCEAPGVGSEPRSGCHRNLARPSH